MSYVIMEMGNDLAIQTSNYKWDSIRYRIGIEAEYITKNGQIYLLNPRVHYREVSGIYTYVNKNESLHVPQIDKDIHQFYEILERFINDLQYNKAIYKHFFKDMVGYPEDVYDGVYFEFN